MLICGLPVARGWVWCIHVRREPGSSWGWPGSPSLGVHAVSFPVCPLLWIGGTLGANSLRRQLCGWKKRALHLAGLLPAHCPRLWGSLPSTHSGGTSYTWSWNIFMGHLHEETTQEEEADFQGWMHSGTRAS